MAEPKEQPVSYLEAVGEILFESPDDMTDADHFVVVQRGINTRLNTEHRALVYEYARASITDPELQAKALLLIAANGVNGIEAYDPCYGGNQQYMIDDNDARFAETRSVLKDITGGDLLSIQEVVIDSFNLILKLETEMSDSDRFFGLGSYKEKIEATQELVAMATSCLDAARIRLPEATSALGHPLHKLYMGQLKHVPRSEVGDRIIETVLELVNESTDDAVTDSLRLVSQTKEDNTKRAILDRVIAITTASDRERQVRVRTEEKTSLFGLLKIGVTEIPEEQPSDFDVRLALLADEVIKRVGKLEEILELHPDYVKRVVELHDPERQEELWQQFVEQIAALAFTNGSYRISEISQIMGIVQRFGEVAPAEVTAHAKEQVRQRLALASPTDY